MRRSFLLAFFVPDGYNIKSKGWEEKSKRWMLLQRAPVGEKGQSRKLPNMVLELRTEGIFKASLRLRRARPLKRRGIGRSFPARTL
jgi:hypothetical protein